MKYGVGLLAGGLSSFAKLQICILCHALQRCPERVSTIHGIAASIRRMRRISRLIHCLCADPSRGSRIGLVSIGILALSFMLPLRLSFTKSKRLAGVTPSAQMTLAPMHTVIAAAAVTVLTRTEGIQ
jgi:hypothetical protein